MRLVALSLGSNINREDNIRYAIKEIAHRFGDVDVSPVYETSAVGFDGPPFYNLVVAIRTDLDLPEIIEVLRAIESGAGRVRGPKTFDSRVLDIDVILYGDEVSPAMQAAIDETERRRAIQIAYNKENNITPQTVKKAIRKGIELELRARKTAKAALSGDEQEYDRAELIAELESAMLEAAQGLEFEKAASIRDKLSEVKAQPALEMVKLSKDKAASSKPGTPGTRPRQKRKKKFR